jgi:hypothetical protein
VSVAEETARDWNWTRRGTIDSFLPKKKGSKARERRLFGAGFAFFLLDGGLDMFPHAI